MITEEYIPFHKVIALLEDFTNRHFVLNSFGFGNLLEYGQDIEEKENLYPVLFVVPQSVIYNEQETQFSFSIVIADRLSEDLRNRISAISNMSAIGKDLVSEIKLGEFQEYFDVDLPINATTFIERFEDNVGGVALDITLTTLDPLNVCEKVISVSPTPTPSITPTPTETPIPPTPSPTPTITPSPNPVCPQQIVISDTTNGSVIPNGTYNELTFAGTEYGYFSGGTFFTGTAPDGNNYKVFGIQPSSTYYTYCWDAVNEDWGVGRSNYAYLGQGGTYTGGVWLGASTSVVFGSEYLPGTGSKGVFTIYYLSYPVLCPTPSITPTNTPTPTETIAPTSTPTQTITPTATGTPTPTPTITPSPTTAITYYILAENGDALLTEGGDNLRTEQN